ncbi:MAG: D-alanyl-D-alanine carboxypeptidase/D-alanyl-D-alanine-endopeptidase [Deltaproteobacteria bacterium]|jgi:D-alanyl-D-alanine carboxypeptidase/D-alanyl-D-alanine-endopeptidase (penicillin-binding protein 4)|nr:D-alanyl-D-alanine carboxypeptidase/D-alanyl-D-alanine-endopeptidase [Deltaproteobacteria bacterium]
MRIPNIAPRSVFCAMGLLCPIFFAATAVHASQAGTLANRLESQVKAAGFKKDEVGVWISDGINTVYAHHADKKFIPASLSKIPTAAAALSILPQGHKFKTTLVADPGNASIASNLTSPSGIMKGPLYLVGGGDPSFVSETIWFLVNEFTRTGIKEVDGDLVVDDSRFDSIRFGEDRQSQRVDRAYDAPLGAMSLNWNSVTAWVRPASKQGEPAQILMDIASPFIRLQNKTKTGKPGQGFSISIERLKSENPADGDTFLATGSIGSDHPEKAIYKSIRDPAFWTAQSVKTFFEARGIKIKGAVRQGVAPSKALVLATAESKALPLIVSDMMKWSNNYVADMLVKNLAAEAGERPATTSHGIKQVRQYLEKAAGLKASDFEFINGAGFTRENSFTPGQLGAVLTAVRNDFRIFPEFLSALPIAGIDGTLRSRFRGLDGTGWVRAKSGLLNGAIGLAGYAGDDQGRIYTFVLLFNGAAGKEEVARALFDRLATTLVKTM